MSAPVPTFAEATRVWLRIGLLSFGGPAGQIALMHRELVDRRRWISEERFLNGLNFCMLLPGPEAMQLATYIGWLLHGVRGGIVAGALFVLPGFAVILTLATGYALFQGQMWFSSLFFGLKAAVLAVVVEALMRVAKRALKSYWAYGIAIASFAALFLFNLPFPLVVLSAGLIGFFGERAFPGWLGTKPVAIVGQGIVTPPFHVVRTSAIWGALWGLPVLALGLWAGWDSIYPALALFFSKMAMVTFGGAYTVLAYVAQAAVETFGWLKPGQMIDGLALAETTPGPLILVLTFVGFLAAFQAPGALSPLAGGLLGAVITTWVTFIPCFYWIFLGAPFIQRIGENRALAGALAAIGAAVVGVILNLTVWFALQTLFGTVERLQSGPFDVVWPAWATLDWRALLLAGLAMLALLRWHVGLVPVLGLSAMAGLVIKTML